MSDLTFPDIDTSYWKIKDKEWMQSRQQKWAAIEVMLESECHKSRKALNIIKRYYLSGSMPDFEALKDFGSDYGHLDLFCFIWLHPSRDKQVLVNLRNEYVHSSLLSMEDTWYGIATLLSAGTVTASYDYSEGSVEQISKRLYTGENEFLLDVLLGDMNASVIPESGGLTWSVSKYRSTLVAIYSLGTLLCNKSLHKVNEDVIYQYDKFAEYWYQSVSNPEFPKQQTKKLTKPTSRKVVIKQLYRIWNFDIESEGDTCRTRSVIKFRKLFDEREFVPEFSEIWEDVKAGKFDVENPWER